ncbi:MAG: imidazole glycerol phosphate synthase subunit HisH, partial [Planctomycetota bacterium]
MIGILDYGMGNLRSVQKAFDRLGGPRAVVVTQPDDVAGCEKIVLPGVGNFADGMRHLDDRGFVEPVRAFIDTGRPLLGICMGMQLLFDGS